MASKGVAVMIRQHFRRSFLVECVSGGSVDVGYPRLWRQQRLFCRRGLLLLDTFLEQLITKLVLKEALVMGSNIRLSRSISNTPEIIMTVSARLGPTLRVAAVRNCI